MRQLMNAKNVAKLAAKTGLPIVHVTVRGNTGHRKDLWLEDGSIVCLWPDGEMTWEKPLNIKDIFPELKSVKRIDLFPKVSRI